MLSSSEHVVMIPSIDCSSRKLPGHGQKEGLGLEQVGAHSPTTISASRVEVPL